MADEKPFVGGAERRENEVSTKKKMKDTEELLSEARQLTRDLSDLKLEFAEAANLVAEAVIREVGEIAREEIGYASRSQTWITHEQRVSIERAQKDYLDQLRRLSLLTKEAADMQQLRQLRQRWLPPLVAAGAFVGTASALLLFLFFQ